MRTDFCTSRTLARTPSALSLPKQNAIRIIFRCDSLSAAHLSGVPDSASSPTSNEYCLRRMLKGGMEMTGLGFFFRSAEAMGRAENIAQLNSGLSKATTSMALDAMVEQRTLAGT